MPESTPHESDLVLGKGTTPLPLTAAVLGGLDGVKQRLASESIAQRIESLNNVVQYGDNAIDLAIQALRNDAGEVRRLAKRLLRDRLGSAGRETLLDYNPLDYFTTLNDWNQEVYNSQIGIIDPANNAYILKLKNASWGDDGIASILPSPVQYLSALIKSDFNSQALSALIQDNKVQELQALIFDFCSNHSFSIFAFDGLLEAIGSTGCTLQNIKALYIGECKEIHPLERRTSKFTVGISSNLLNAFPNLEILHLYGELGINRFDRTKLEHHQLKTLIIDGVSIDEAIASICSIDLPELEYLEIWLNDLKDISYITRSIAPILAGKSAPKLKYLGLCNCEFGDDLIRSIIESPIIHQLAVLDFKMGTLSDRGVRSIIDYEKLGNLKFLNIDRNCISDLAISELRQLPIQIESNTQYQSVNDRFNQICRYKPSSS